MTKETFPTRSYLFVLKNVGETYQQMMNKIFIGNIKYLLEVYMDDLIVKSEEEPEHITHMESIFGNVRKYGICLNPKKFNFRVRPRKIIGY